MVPYFVTSQLVTELTNQQHKLNTWHPVSSLFLAGHHSSEQESKMTWLKSKHILKHNSPTTDFVSHILPRLSTVQLFHNTGALIQQRHYNLNSNQIRETLLCKGVPVLLLAILISVQTCSNIKM